MGKFNELNKNINDIMLELVSSDNLCKLINYNTETPTNESDFNTVSLLFNKIFPFPKIPDTTDEQSTNLCVILDNFTTDRSNVSIKEGSLVFLVILHNDLWKIKGGIRPFSILHELDELFIDKRVVGLKKLQFDRARYVSFNEKFSGYEINYRFINAN